MGLPQTKARYQKDSVEYQDVRNKVGEEIAAELLRYHYLIARRRRSLSIMGILAAFVGGLLCALFALL